jgi:hypothetical protein
MSAPNRLSRQAIEEFQAIYLEEFGQHLSDDEVQQIALRLLRCFEILAQPVEAVCQIRPSPTSDH